MSLAVSPAPTSSCSICSRGPRPRTSWWPLSASRRAGCGRGVPGAPDVLPACAGRLGACFAPGPAGAARRCARGASPCGSRRPCRHPATGVRGPPAPGEAVSGLLDPGPVLRRRSMARKIAFEAVLPSPLLLLRRPALLQQPRRRSPASDSSSTPASVSVPSRSPSPPAPSTSSWTSTLVPGSVLCQLLLSSHRAPSPPRLAKLVTSATPGCAVPLDRMMVEGECRSVPEVERALCVPAGTLSRRFPGRYGKLRAVCAARRDQERHRLLSRCRMALDETIEGPEVRSVHAVARSLGVGSESLRRWFPDRFRRLVEVYAERSATFRRDRLCRRLQAVRAAVCDLVAQGERPSLHRAVLRAHLPPTFCTEPSVRAVWSGAFAACGVALPACRC